MEDFFFKGESPCELSHHRNGSCSSQKLVFSFCVGDLHLYMMSRQLNDHYTDVAITAFTKKPLGPSLAAGSEVRPN